MPLMPGTSVVLRDSLPPRSNPGDTSTLFVVGFAERGPASPVAIRSMSAFKRFFGDRVSYSTLYDALDTFFREGGRQAVISRVLGPAPTVATKNLLDASSGVALTVNAKYSGDWGPNIKVGVAAGSVGGTFVIFVQYNNVEVERSPDLLDTAAAVAWSTGSDYVTIVQGASVLDPAVIAAAALVGGTDDHTNAVDANWKTALDRFTRDMGPGQLAMPGRTTSQAHLDQLQHAATYNRVALLDAPDTAVVATLTAAATAARAGGNGRYGAMFGPWALVPGLTAGTTRAVPYSMVVAGAVARNDGLLSPNAPAAGENGIAQYTIGLTQNAWTEAERQTLFDGGFNVARILFDGVRTYGWRTLVNPSSDPNWINLGNTRLAMAITGDADIIAERYVLSQIDGQGLTLSAFSGELIAMLNGFYTSGALYGLTPDEAFAVDTGPQVNTDATVALGELHAALAVKMSPMAERVIIEITKVALTEGVI